MDVWGLGICLYYMLFKESPPWIPDPDGYGVSDITNVFDFHYQAICCKRKLHTYTPSIDRRAVDLLQNMLLNDPTKRLSTQKILNHPWFEESLDSLHHQDYLQEGDLECLDDPDPLLEGYLECFLE